MVLRWAGILTRGHGLDTLCPAPCLQPRWARGLPTAPTPAPGATSWPLSWCPQLQNITSHPHLLTVHDFEQEGSEELDTVILKALVKGEGLAGWTPPGRPREGTGHRGHLAEMAWPTTAHPTAQGSAPGTGCFPHPVPSWGMPLCV